MVPRKRKSVQQREDHHALSVSYMDSHDFETGTHPLVYSSTPGWVLRAPSIPYVVFNCFQHFLL